MRLYLVTLFDKFYIISGFCSWPRWLLHWVLQLWISRCQFHPCSTSSFCMRRSQKRKKDWQLGCLLMLLGPVLIKDARRTLIQLTPDHFFKEKLAKAELNWVSSISKLEKAGEQLKKIANMSKKRIQGNSTDIKVCKSYKIWTPLSQDWVQVKLNIAWFHIVNPTINFDRTLKATILAMNYHIWYDL